MAVRAGGEHMTARGRFAEDIKRYRQVWGVSQKRLAEQAGTTQTVISQLEAGKGNPTLEMLERIAEACDMRLEVALRLKDRGYTRKQ